MPHVSIKCCKVVHKEYINFTSHPYVIMKYAICNRLRLFYPESGRDQLLTGVGVSPRDDVRIMFTPATGLMLTQVAIRNINQHQSIPLIMSAIQWCMFIVTGMLILLSPAGVGKEYFTNFRSTLLPASWEYSKHHLLLKYHMLIW